MPHILAHTLAPTLGWFHDISPFLIQFSPGVGVRWYGLSYALGFLLGWMWLRRLSKNGTSPMSEARMTDAMLALVIGVVAGGRLGYVLFYEPKLLITFTDSVPWWGLLQVNKGGMASHGGVLGVAIASWVIARGPKAADGTRPDRVPMLHPFDCAALACTPGLGLGRIANFINGELLGKIATSPGTTGPWWSVQFPQEILSGHAPPLGAAQEAALATIVRPYMTASNGESFDAAYENVLAVIQSGSPVGRELATQLQPLISSRHPTQLYQCFAESVVVGTALFLIWRKKRSPGVITAWFLIIYGVGRILTEFVRLPDTHVQVQRFLGFSRGQWLSVLMIVIGCGLLAGVRRYTQRHPNERKFGPRTT